MLVASARTPSLAGPQLLYLLAESPNNECDGVPSAAGLSPEKLFFVGGGQVVDVGAGKTPHVTAAVVLAADDDGNVVDSSQDGSFAYLHGASNIIPGLEKALEGQEVGATLDVAVPPEEGYGERNDALSESVPKEMFGGVDEIEVGMRFHAQTQQGELRLPPGQVESIELAVRDIAGTAGHRARAPVRPQGG